MQDNGNLVLLNPSNQAFWVSNTPEITKKFQNQATKRCLDSNFNGVVYTLTCNTGLYQNWVIIKYLDGYSTIMNKSTGLYLTVSGSSILTRTRDGTTNQDWRIAGTQLLNRVTNKVLDSNDVGSVYSSTPNTFNYQKWNQV
jgi:serine/threonine-protein kinase